MFGFCVFGGLTYALLHLQRQVMRKGNHLVSYYAANGFLPAECMLLLVYPLLLNKCFTNVLCSNKSSHSKETQDFVVTLTGAVLSNEFSVLRFKSLHFIGVILWLYGLPILALARAWNERKERVDQDKRVHSLTRSEIIILGYQSFFSVIFAIAYSLKMSSVAQISQFGIILLYTLWYGKDLAQVGSGFSK